MSQSGGTRTGSRFGIKAVVVAGACLVAGCFTAAYAFAGESGASSKTATNAERTR